MWKAKIGQHQIIHHQICDLYHPREASLGDHDKITIEYQLDMHLVSDEDHVTP